jgi:hypothetical protein
MSAPRRTASLPRNRAGCSPRSSSASSRAMSPMTSPPAWRTNSTMSRAGVPNGRIVLAKFWKDFKPKSDEVMERKPSEVTEALDEFLVRLPVPAARGRHRSAQCPKCAAKGGPRCAAGAWRLRRLRELSRVQIHPQVRPARRRGEGGEDAANLASIPKRARHQPQGRPVRPLFPDGRRQGSQARLDPQGHCPAANSISTGR